MAVIEKTVEIAARPETVWRFLEDPDLLAGWLMRNDFAPKEGARFHFFAKPGGDWNGVIESEVVEFDPPRKLAFTWNANNIGADTLVTIELESKGDNTVLSLRHINWAGAKGDLDTHIATHSEGWEDHLQVLAKGAAELRDDDDEAPAIDWTRFQCWVAIDAKPADVFKSWATSGGMESFFVEAMQMRAPDGALRGADEIVQEGDSYVWRWNSGRIIQGEVLEVRQDREITYTFGDCKFRINAHPYKDGTLLELEQYDMEDTEMVRMHVHTNCRAAWVYFLSNLKALHEHGIDIRDTTRETGSSFSTYFSPEAVGIAL